jgi:hypothetical protein
MLFTLEFFRVRGSDGAHATLDRIFHDAHSLADAKRKARSLFYTLNMPQAPDAYVSWIKVDASCFWTPGHLHIEGTDQALRQDRASHASMRRVRKCA